MDPVQLTWSPSIKSWHRLHSTLQTCNMSKLKLSAAFELLEWIIECSQVNFCDVYTTVIVIMILWTAFDESNCSLVVLKAFSRVTGALAWGSSAHPLQTRHHCLGLNCPQCTFPSFCPKILWQWVYWVESGSLLPHPCVWLLFKECIVLFFS